MKERKTNLYEGGASNEDEFDQLKDIDNHQGPQRQTKKGVAEQILESVDAYGEPISLKYQGRSTYNTVCGGISTLITVILLMIILINKLGSNQQIRIRVEDQRDSEDLNNGIRQLIQLNLKGLLNDKISENRNLQQTDNIENN